MVENPSRVPSDGWHRGHGLRRDVSAVDLFTQVRRVSAADIQNRRGGLPVHHPSCSGGGPISHPVAPLSQGEMVAWSAADRVVWKSEHPFLRPDGESRPWPAQQAQRRAEQVARLASEATPAQWDSVDGVCGSPPTPVSRLGAGCSTEEKGTDVCNDGGCALGRRRRTGPRCPVEPPIRIPPPRSHRRGRVPAAPVLAGGDCTTRVCTAALRGRDRCRRPDAQHAAAFMRGRRVC